MTLMSQVILVIFKHSWQPYQEPLAWAILQALPLQYQLVALEPFFGRPDRAKLGLEQHFGRPDGAKTSLELRFGRSEPKNFVDFVHDLGDQKLLHKDMA